jgi:peptidoglycan hydrolase-like protein with peptidoglycan-binding domain
MPPADIGEVTLTKLVRPLLVGVLVVTALAAPSPVSRPEPASAYTTIFYDGAGDAPHIGLIGDSTLAATRWYGILGELTRYNFVLDAESCRRTTHTSCRGREGYAPENTLTVMRRLEGRWGRVLVLMTGYDDPGFDFGDAIDAVMREAIRQGIPRVMWLTFRTADVTYVGPTYNSDLHTFRDNNKLLLQKALRYGGRLQIANWAGYSARHPGWVASDGVHLTPAGTIAVTEFIADKVAAVLAGRTITPPRPNIPACRTGVVLRRRDRLNDVYCLERHLDSLGFPVAVDNRYGPTTVAAVKFLDYARSWPQDGVASRRVLRAIGAFRPRTPTPWCHASRTLRAGMHGPGVHCLVRALHARGYLLKTSSRQFHPPVGAAVAHFRRGVGLPRSRVAGWETLSRLGIYRPSCRISRPLGPGDGGPAVACLRRFLFGRGRAIPLVGGYGTQVTHAVRVIEARRGLPVDGIADVAFLRVIGAWRDPR